MEYTKRARRCRESEDFANDNEEEEVSSNEEANSKANQPNNKASGHGEGLPPKEGGATLRCLTTRPHLRPIRSRILAKRPTRRPTRAGAVEEQTP
jgi:hypothetical protein